MVYCSYNTRHSVAYFIKHKSSSGWVMRKGRNEAEKMKTLKERRKAAGLTLIGLSEKTGIHYNSLLRYEKGTASPGIENLKRISEALSCSVSELLGEERAEIKPCDIAFAELEKAAEPLVELLRKKGTPMLTVIVTSRSVDVEQSVMGVPFPYDD